MVEIGTRAGKSAESVRRLLKLSEALGEAKVHDAYEIEKAADAKLSLGHLEELSKVEERKAFIQAAATTAVTRADPGEIQKDVLPVASETCRGIPWFPTKFPEYAEAKDGEGDDAGEEDDDDEEETRDTSSSVIAT